MSAPSFLKPASHAVSEDKLDVIRETARHAAQSELIVKDLEHRTIEAKQQLYELYNKTLPDLMDAVGLNKISVEAKGNLPAFDLAVGPYYKASIPEAWDDEQKTAAFKYLEQQKAGDLIKHVIVIEFDTEEHVVAKKLLAELRKKTYMLGKQKRKYNVSISKTVHWATLTSWLRYQVEHVKKVPNLPILNATVGRVAKLKENK